MDTYWRKFAFSAMLTSMLSVLAIGLLFGGAHYSYGAAPTGPAGQAGNSNSNADPQGAYNVTTGSDAARTKLSPGLRGATGKVWVTVFHHTSAGAALRKIEPSLYQRAYTMKDGSTLSIGQVDAAKLVKLASIDGVERIADYTDAQPDVITPEGPVKGRGTETLQAKGAQWEKQRANGAKLTPAQNRQSNAPEDWYDVSDGGHRAAQAWENGYDGTGVRVGVLDTGVDFGHPDLAGMYAVYPSGVYSGWPYAWSDKSVAYWNILHEASTPENYDWSESGLNTFVDTSRTLAAPTGVTTTGVITIPVADFVNGGSDTITHTYTLPTNSKSGIVHVGFHPDPSATWLNAPEYSQPALVVVDRNTAGVYDTVYVDYDNDHNFNNDEPFSKSNTTASYDVDGDTIADFSGGLLYWIADGTNPPAGSYIWTDEPIVPGAGDLVAFMFDTDPFFSSHGTHCASNVVAQGVITGDQADGTPVAPWKPGGDETGNVYGTANDARVAPMVVYQLASNYVDSNLYAALGPDGEPGTGDEVHITSNSYGFSEEDAEGWDVRSRQFAQINLHINPNMTILVSTGNGAAGYGTITSPAGSTTVIGVGASTLYGSTTTFDSITSTQQINWGDVQSWSGRGPSSIGRGPMVLANGAWGGGNIPINVAFTGNDAWVSWGGTSKSAPTAAGVVALIYDAFEQANGRYPTFEEARHLLMAGANENGYDVYQQGAGVVDAVRSTDAAAGNAGGAIVPSPSYLVPGSFNGVKYGETQSFINLMTPGSSSTDVISLTNTSAFTRTVNVTSTMLQLAGTQVYHQHTISNTESPYASPQFGVANRPDYIVHEFDPAEIPADTSYMVVQQAYPFENFNPELNYNNSTAATNNFRVVVYRWTDVNGDGNLWEDTNGNGAVNEGEIDQYEFLRFNYGYNLHTTQQASVGYPMYKINNCEGGGKNPSGACPQERIFIGILHRNRHALTPETDLTVKVSFYRKVPFNWLSLSDTSVTLLPFSTVGVEVTTNVPAGTGVGMYEGAIWLQEPSDGGVASPDVHLDTPGDYTTQVPVSIAVAANSSTFDFAGQGRQDTPYDNNVVWGYNDWSWRQEAGDWRFYNTNVPAAEVSAGSFWLVHTSWDNYFVPTNTIPTDLDTYIQGPTPSGVSGFDPANFGPYRLSQVGGSSFQYLGSGVWRFQTATGGTEEWVSGRLQPGLNQIQVRTTVFNGRQIDEPFNGEAGQVSVSPYPVGSTDCDGTGTVSVNISSTLSIPSVETFSAGLSQPVTTTEEISLDELKYYTFTLTNPAVLDVRTTEGGSNPAPDVDIRIQKNVDGNWVTIGASEGGTSTEQVRITLPGPGEYRVRVHGFAVSNSPGTFLLIFNNIDGTDLQVVSAPPSLAPGETGTVELAYNQNLAPGTYNGALFVGPQGAVGAIFIPITITVTGDCPEPPACEIEFQDVPPSSSPSSFYPFVECLACRNIIGGYPCGDVNPVSGLEEPCGETGNPYYRPDNNITRGQIAKIVAQSAGYDTEAGPQIYADVPPEQVFWIYVQQLSNDGIMGGYPCGGVNPQTGEDEECDGLMRPYFRVNNYATRGQLSKIVANAAGVTYSGSAQTYVDVPRSNDENSFYRYIEGLTAMGVMSGYACGTTHPRSGPCVAPNNRPYFRPELNVTRGQAAKIVSNTFFPNCEDPAAKP